MVHLVLNFSRLSAHLIKHLFHVVSCSQHSPVTYISWYWRSRSASRLANSSVIPSSLHGSIESAQKSVPLNVRRSGVGKRGSEVLNDTLTSLRYSRYQCLWRVEGTLDRSVPQGTREASKYARCIDIVER